MAWTQSYAQVTTREAGKYSFPLSPSSSPEAFQWLMIIYHDWKTWLTPHPYRKVTENQQKKKTNKFNHSWELLCSHTWKSSSSNAGLRTGSQDWVSLISWSYFLWFSLRKALTPQGVPCPSRPATHLPYLPFQWREDSSFPGSKQETQDWISLANLGHLHIPDPDTVS